MSRNWNQRRMRRGFTLMEVLIVLAILVILGATAVGIFTGAQRTAERRAAQVQVEALDNASERYQAITNEYPTQLLDLNQQPAHLTPSQWGGIPHIEDIPLDPWGNEYQYAYPGTNNAHLGKPDIWSMGPDGASGTEDDLGNWPAMEY